MNPSEKEFKDSKARKKSSLRKIESNRRNSLRSSGPRTSQGKRAVRWNAVKHGLLAKEVVIREGDGAESAEEFRNLHAQLREDLQPEGVVEEMLVEKVAVGYWRLRRVLRCEIGEIRHGLDTVTTREAFRRVEEFRYEKRFLRSSEFRENLEKSSLGLQYLMGVLAEVREEVEQVGHLSQEAQRRLVENFGDEEYGLFCWCRTFSRMATEGPQRSEEDPDHPGEIPNPEQCTKMILSLIDSENQKLQNLKELITANEALEVDAKRASLTLPSAKATEKILRYETTIERQLYRAMSELERLQRQRKGERVLPPLSLDVRSEN